MEVLKKEPPKKNIGQTEKLYRDGITLGRNIALIGFFCPIFWISLIMGAEESTIVFNLIHSGIVFGIGLLVMLVNYIRLRLG